MKTIEIYENYGCLAAEKRKVYTYGAEHATATCCEKITAEIPDGWELFENTMGQKMVKAPWGWEYGINEVLKGNERPEFCAMDKNGNLKRFALKVIE